MMNTTKKPMIVPNVRMQSAAGFYIGSVEFDGVELAPYDRDEFCGYYKTEAHLQQDYPNSISMEEAVSRAVARKMYIPPTNLLPES